MIIIQLTGGLGNQLFQYAIGKKLAIQNNTELKLDTNFFKTYKWHEYSLTPFNIQTKYISILNKFLIQKGIIKTYSENSFDCDISVLEIPNNTYLKGYFQSYKYFNDLRDELLKDFTIKAEPSEKNKLYLNEITNCNSISLHIRRGNYINIEHVNKHHGVCSIDYYKKAIEIITNKISDPLFFVFSDDIQWAKNNLTFIKNIKYVEINDAKTDYEDLRLMANCRHQIIANSTFSWWGAWLNKNINKIVIAPQKWINDSSINTNDLIPNNWIRI